MASLRALGLNIRRAKLEQGQEHKFYVTDERTSEKAGAGCWVGRQPLVLIVRARAADARPHLLLAGW